ncbi:hypothetical protein HF086_000627 [Spodoptera exigua]|uniref:Uncharacterized protein n=1 Tax=Spodoptera exigua TaxID=7107 RepID=A0A922SEF6_SPOEX|nr:hypothetical protein HF086_000627 [Spodoptera exigua]
MDDELPILRNICIQSVPDSVAMPEGRPLFLEMSFINMYPLNDLRMEWSIGSEMFYRSSFRQILSNLIHLGSDRKHNKFIVLLNKWLFAIRITLHESVVYVQKPTPRVTNRLELRSIMPTTRPGTPSWAYHYRALNIRTAKRAIKIYGFNDMDSCNASGEDASSSSVHQTYSLQSPLRPEIRRIRRLLPPIPRFVIPRYGPSRQERRAPTNFTPVPGSWSSPRETVQFTTVRRRLLPAPTRTLFDPHWPDRQERHYASVGNVPAMSRSPFPRDMDQRPHRRQIPPLPPRRRLLPPPSRALPITQETEKLRQIIVKRPQNLNHELVPAVPARCLSSRDTELRSRHLQSTPTRQRATSSLNLASPRSQDVLKRFQPRDLSLTSTTSTPSTVRCISPLINIESKKPKTPILDTKYLYHRPYRDKNEDESLLQKDEPNLKAFSPSSLNDVHEGGENLRGLVETYEESQIDEDSLPTPSPSKWASPTWAKVLSLSPDVDTDAHQEIITQAVVYSEGQESLGSTITPLHEAVNAVDSVITIFEDDIHVVATPEDDHDELTPRNFAIPVRPKSLPRRVLTNCMKFIVNGCSRINAWGNLMFRNENHFTRCVCTN